MNAIINALSAQANELMKSQTVRDMLAECSTDEERCKMYNNNILAQAQKLAETGMSDMAN